MDTDTRSTVLRRLAYIEGHLGGVRKMIESDQHCPDVLRQTFAVRRAMKKLESKILVGHLRRHMLRGIEERDETMLDELVDLYDLAHR
jgi:CsoR family transcriptional regulator, copper-sensing transcriptional repressor